MISADFPSDFVDSPVSSVFGFPDNGEGGSNNYDTMKTQKVRKRLTSFMSNTLDRIRAKRPRMGSTRTNPRYSLGSTTTDDYANTPVRLRNDKGRTGGGGGDKKKSNWRKMVNRVSTSRRKKDRKSKAANGKGGGTTGVGAPPSVIPNSMLLQLGLPSLDKHNPVSNSPRSRKSLITSSTVESYDIISADPLSNAHAYHGWIQDNDALWLRCAKDYCDVVCSNKGHTTQHVATIKDNTPIYRVLPDDELRRYRHRHPVFMKSPTGDGRVGGGGGGAFTSSAHPHHSADAVDGVYESLTSGFKSLRRKKRNDADKERGDYSKFTGIKTTQGAPTREETDLVLSLLDKVYFKDHTTEVYVTRSWSLIHPEVKMQYNVLPMSLPISGERNDATTTTSPAAAAVSVGNNNNLRAKLHIYDIFTGLRATQWICYYDRIIPSGMMTRMRIIEHYEEMARGEVKIQRTASCEYLLHPVLEQDGKDKALEMVSLVEESTFGACKDIPMMAFRYSQDRLMSIIQADTDKKKEAKETNKMHLDLFLEAAVDKRGRTNLMSNNWVTLSTYVGIIDEYMEVKYDTSSGNMQIVDSVAGDGDDDYLYIGAEYNTIIHEYVSDGMLNRGGGGGGGDIFTYDENSVGVNRRASSPPNYDIPRPNPDEVFMATSPSRSSSSPPRQGFNNDPSSIQNVNPVTAYCPYFLGPDNQPYYDCPKPPVPIVPRPQTHRVPDYDYPPSPISVTSHQQQQQQQQEEMVHDKNPIQSRPLPDLPMDEEMSSMISGLTLK
ncbi:hypothetical protein FOL46_000436 [Perkinsus olseni]|uniref:Uncharacterized protein n=1 Tax=Perkinsus olseni TaxID=32597 RepID=A0A7J6KXS4_PEROL|nr:hypothetical protein FOL46_000436 [Perkinsus olseni]